MWGTPSTGQCREHMADIFQPGCLNFALYLVPQRSALIRSVPKHLLLPGTLVVYMGPSEARGSAAPSACLNLGTKGWSCGCYILLGFVFLLLWGTVLIWGLWAMCFQNKGGFDLPVSGSAHLSH